MRSPNITYLPNVDHIRAFAALWIVAYHSLQLIGSVMISAKWFSPTPWLNASNPLTAFLIEGHSAVALFMVLSGFIFTYGTYGKEISYGSFIFNRALRIYPLYGVTIFLAISADPGVFSFSDMATSVLPLADFNAIKSGMVGMSWAVAVELQFYLIFPFLLISINKSAWKTLLGIIVVAIILRSIAVGHGANPRDISYGHLIGRIDQFVIGMAAAVFMRTVNIPKMVNYLLLLSSAVVIFCTLFGFNRLGGWEVIAYWKLLWPTLEGAMYAVFIVAYIGSGKLLPSLVSDFFCQLGKTSFSIYLLHFPIVLLVASKPELQWRPTGNGATDFFLTFVCLVLPAILLFSQLTYRVIELPFLQQRRSYIILKSADMPVNKCSKEKSASM